MHEILVADRCHVCLAPPVGSDGEQCLRAGTDCHGHLIGATSALELLVTVVAMQQSLLPDSAHLDEVDPRCELNHVGPRPLAGRAVDHALSFSCGFGGTNVALVVSRNPTPPVPD